jgi:hypothetical protein
MQKYLSHITIFLFMASCGISCAQAISITPPVLPSQSQTGSVASEFEGRYKVGNTYCTVKPIKMAFEVRWAKGKGSMIFFFGQTTPDGKVVFVSKKLGKGRDQFVFDDDRYNVGVFIRADGKVFAIERSQN